MLKSIELKENCSETSKISSPKLKKIGGGDWRSVPYFFVSKVATTSCGNQKRRKTNVECTKVLPRPETPRDSGSQQTCIPSMTMRKSTGSTDWSVCIVCSMRTHRKHKKLHKIETYLRDIMLKEAAYERRDGFDS